MVRSDGRRLTPVATNGDPPDCESLPFLPNQRHNFRRARTRNFEYQLSVRACVRVCACVCVCIMQRGEKLNCENSLEGMNYHLHSGNFRIGVSPASRVKTFVFIPATVAPLTETVEQCSNQSDLPGT